MKTTMIAYMTVCK